MTDSAPSLRTHLEAAVGFVSTTIDVGPDSIPSPAWRTFQATDLQRHSGTILEQAERQTVLVRDKGGQTFAFEPWDAWHYQHAILGVLAMVVTSFMPSARRRRRPSVDAVDVASSPWSSHELELAPELAPLDESLRRCSLEPLAGVLAVGKTSSRSGSPSAFTATGIQKDYRKALDSAKASPVTITRSDEPIAVIEDASTLLAEKQLLRHFENIRLFLTAFALHAGAESPAWVRQTAYAWLEPLPAARVKDFADGLLPQLLEALNRQDPNGFTGHLRSWQLAAMAVDSEVLAARLAEPLEPDSE